MASSRKSSLRTGYAKSESRLPLLSPAQLGWVTGLFEGEGSISLAYKQSKPRARLTVVSTDLDVLERLQAITQIGTITLRRRLSSLGTKPIWAWQVQRQNEALDLLEQMLPLLCNRRAERAREVIGSCDRLPTRPTNSSTPSRTPTAASCSASATST